MSYFTKLGQARFNELTKSYASAKDALQAALGAAIYQALIHDNPNWLNQLWEECGFWQSPVDGKYQVSKDGKAVYAYLTTAQANGGCGLTAEILSLDRKEKKWVLRKGRALAVTELDKAFLAELLDTVRWDKWGKPQVDKSAKAYNPHVPLARIQTALAEALSTNGAGLDVDYGKILDQIEAIRKSILASKPQLKVAA